MVEIMSRTAQFIKEMKYYVAGLERAGVAPEAINNLLSSFQDDLARRGGVSRDQLNNALKDFSGKGADLKTNAFFREHGVTSTIEQTRERVHALPNNHPDKIIQVMCDNDARVYQLGTLPILIDTQHRRMDRDSQGEHRPPHAKLSQAIRKILDERQGGPAGNPPGTPPRNNNRGCILM
jgi:hypothetical protein